MWGRRVLLGISLVVNIVLAYRLIWSDQGLVAYRGLKEQHEYLEGRIKELDVQNLALSQEIRRIQSDKEYLEKIIRKRFNSLYVKDNEVLYIFPEVQEATRLGATADETKN